VSLRNNNNNLAVQLMIFLLARKAFGFN